MRTPQGTGWLAKQEAAKAAMAKRENGYHPVYDNEADRARREMLAAKAEEDRLAREAAEARITHTVTRCPCCAGKGHTPVPDAAAWVEARRRYDFVGWKPDMATISELMRSAIVVDRDGTPITETVSLSTMDGESPETAADSDEDAIAALEKPRRKR